MSQMSEKLLFTPGPLTTSSTVKQAALYDFGSRDQAFIQIVSDVRERIVRLALADPAQYTCVLMQGSGTFGIEAVIGTVIPSDGKLLVAVNGAYGRRMARIAQLLRIPVVECAGPENAPVDVTAVLKAVEADSAITHVATCHVETTSGVLNDIERLGSQLRDRGTTFIVDAMSSFGGIPIDVPRAGIDFLITSSNKCIEGIPGFSVIVARTDALRACEGNARSLALDLLDQYNYIESSGQFRFTPPTHAILAFRQALDELDAEGGVQGRNQRYRANHTLLCSEMARLGFKPFLDPAVRAPIITSFHYPTHPSFSFKIFYDELSERGLLIYPGKVSEAECFRIGNIGRLFEADIRRLCAGIAEVLDSMGVDIPAEQDAS